MRLNDETGATFNPNAFDYRATWNADLARIDMHLISTRAQVVHVGGQGIRFDADEPIHVSAARKYSAESLAALARSAGWSVATRHSDPDDRISVAVLTPHD